MNQRSILIIDDELLILDTMSKDLEEEGYKVDTAKNGDEGVRKFIDNRYDLVIVDLVMPGMGGLEVAQTIKEVKPNTKVIFLTGYGSTSSAIAALRLEASDYFLKPYSRGELFKRVATCFNELKHSGESWGRVLAGKTGEKPLSGREEEIAKLLFDGLSDKEMASRLYITVNTVKTHLKNIYKKLGIKGRTELLKLKVK